MENFYTPNTTTTTTTTATTTTNLMQPNMGSVQNPHFFPPPPPNTQFYYPPHLQIPYTYPTQQQPDHTLGYPIYPFFQHGFQMGLPGTIQGPYFLQPNVSPQEQERRSMEAHRTKLARNNRRLARQRSKNSASSGSSSSSSSVPSSTQVDHGVNTEERNINIDNLYNFCTPDEKRLRVLLKKELKNSDVGSLGRIVLPKREAEENLPSLTEKEGIQIMIRDVYSNQEWTLRFKYWSNNKSRMYVLENTGDFVRQNGLESGDSLTLYEDEGKNLYFSITKVERPAAEPSNEQQQYTNNNDNYLYTPTTYQARDEEDASLYLLIEQLQPKEQQEANNLMTLSVDGASSSNQAEEAKNDPLDNVTNPQPSSSSHGNVGVEHDDSLDDDCYNDLGMLPEYKFIL